MSLSKLQKYILRRGLEGKNFTVSKEILNRFYQTKKKLPAARDQSNIIAKSASRLVNRGLVKAVGVKTAEKWFLKKLVLTARGVRRAKELLGRQSSLPFREKSKRNK